MQMCYRAGLFQLDSLGYVISVPYAFHTLPCYIEMSGAI